MTKAQKAKRTRPRKAGEPSFIEKARKEQIISVAAGLFRDKGFQKTSLEDIATAVGVSRGVLFYYFKGKSEIGEQTVLTSLREYGNYVQERVAKKRTAHGRLFEFIEACVAYHTERPQVYVEYLELLGSLPDEGDRFTLTKAANQRTRSMLVGLIEAGQSDGDIASVNPRALADVIQAFIDGMMETNAMEPGAVNMRQSKNMFIAMLRDYIKPSHKP